MTKIWNVSNSVLVTLASDRFSWTLSASNTLGVWLYRGVPCYRIAWAGLTCWYWSTGWDSYIDPKISWLSLSSGCFWFNCAWDEWVVSWVRPMVNMAQRCHHPVMSWYIHIDTITNGWMYVLRLAVGHYGGLIRLSLLTSSLQIAPIVLVFLLPNSKVINQSIHLWEDEMGGIDIDMACLDDDQTTVCVIPSCVIRLTLTDVMMQDEQKRLRDEGISSKWCGLLLAIVIAVSFLFTLILNVYLLSV